MWWLPWNLARLHGICLDMSKDLGQPIRKCGYKDITRLFVPPQLNEIFLFIIPFTWFQDKFLICPTDVVVDKLELVVHVHVTGLIWRTFAPSRLLVTMMDCCQQELVDSKLFTLSPDQLQVCISIKQLTGPVVWLKHNSMYPAQGAVARSTLPWWREPITVAYHEWKTKPVRHCSF